MDGDTNPSTYGNDSSFDESSTPHTVSFDGALEDLNITFTDISGLVEADTWIVLISACGATNPLPAGASATLTHQDGTSAVAQLTLDRGFEGTVSGSHDIYAVNQHFTVRDTGTEMQTITVSNSGTSSAWANGSPSYGLNFNGSTPTACIAYDAEDWELEVILRDYMPYAKFRDGMSEILTPSECSLTAFFKTRKLDVSDIAVDSDAIGMLVDRFSQT